MFFSGCDRCGSRKPPDPLPMLLQPSSPSVPRRRRVSDQWSMGQKTCWWLLIDNEEVELSDQWSITTQMDPGGLWGVGRRSKAVINLNVSFYSRPVCFSPEFINFRLFTVGKVMKYFLTTAALSHVFKIPVHVCTLSPRQDTDTGGEFIKIFC